MWSTFGVCTTPAQAVVVSPDSSTVYATGTTFNGYCTVAYNATTGAVRWHASYQTGQFIHPTANSLALSPDGADLFVTGTAGTVAYAASTGAQLWSDHYKQRWGRDDEHVVVSPDSSTVFVAGATSVTKPEHFLTVAYNAATGAQLWAAQLSPSTFDSLATSVAVSPDGSMVFVAGTSLGNGGTPPTTYLTIAYDASTGTALWVRHSAGNGGNFATLPSLAVSQDGSTVFLASSADAPDGQFGYQAIAYATATGHRLWLARYQSPGGGATIASAIAVTGSEVLVTGTGARNSTQTDYATVALQG
jgi:WD40 repeat protein